MNVLSIQGSISGATSVTRALSATYIEQLKVARPGITVVEHDLSTEVLPHLGGSMVPVQLGMSTEALPVASLSDQLIS